MKNLIISYFVSLLVTILLFALSSTIVAGQNTGTITSITTGTVKTVKSGTAKANKVFNLKTIETRQNGEVKQITAFDIVTVSMDSENKRAIFQDANGKTIVKIHFSNLAIHRTANQGQILKTVISGYDVEGNFYKAQN
jgi:hypothetical protein